MAPEVNDHEIRHWLTAVKSDAALAVAMMPNIVYALLRNEELLDAHHNLSDHALNLIG